REARQGRRAGARRRLLAPGAGDLRRAPRQGRAAGGDRRGGGPPRRRREDDLALGETMAAKKSLTFVLMDAPYENARTVTAFRLLDSAIRKGHDVFVFAYEGAVA